MMESPAPLLVVLADDDDDTRRLIANGLRSAGCVIHEASNGGSLLACVQLLLAREERVGLVLSDINMPEADGISVAARLLALEPSLHVVLMSAFSDAEVLERAHAAGVNRVLRKPFGRTVLFDVLHSECQQEAG